MYKINFSKDCLREGLLCYVEGITIDVSDILMMKYIDILHEGDRNLVSLYLKYVRNYRKKKEQPETITILDNNNENERIIISIISCDWLINEGSLDFNREEYDNRKIKFLEQIDLLKDSKRDVDIHQCMLKQYYIDTYTQALEKQFTKIKE